MPATRRVSNEFSPVSDTTPDSSPAPSPKRHCLQGPPLYSATDAAAAAAAAIGGLAGRACEKCRASKRKCDKKLPFCDRCKRLNAKCHYLQDISNNVNPHGAQFVIYQSHPLTHDSLFRGPEPLDGITASQLLSLVSTGASPGHPQVDWRGAVTNYFFCVHPWFAVVHPAVFERQVAGLVAAVDSPPSDATPGRRDSLPGSGHHYRAPARQATPEWPSKVVALLVLVMYLNTRMRVTDAGEQPVFDETYRTAKRLLSPLLLPCVGDPTPTIELVQAGALMALYEYGHGEIAAAYRTLSQTVVTARALDIKPGQVADSGGDAVMLSVDEEQSGCLWWAMFILEQSIHQDEDAKALPFLLESPTRNTLLPETPPMTPPADGGSFPVSPPPSSSATRHLSAGVLVSREKFGGFQLSAKTASLFHRAIRIDKERGGRRPGEAPPLVAAFADLDREIRETTLALLSDTLDWESVLDCFAMLVSSLFILYLPYLAVLENSVGADLLPPTLSEEEEESSSFSGAESAGAPSAVVQLGAATDRNSGSSAAAAALLSTNQELSTALAALRFACKMSTDISCKLNANYNNAAKSPAQLCAPAGATCYLVILTFASLYRIFPEERAECQANIAEKFESLALFSFRWGIAEKMMAQIEKKMCVDRKFYLKDSKITPPSYAVAFDFARR
ncbi:hypothetical protein F4781DRAFT_433810 [Annulohypoxylon bovei var. microspora]|nr:hypothetical protein F4781DRAFT_433810 [Annulohypoxylon bovei var. microspora]